MAWSFGSRLHEDAHRPAQSVEALRANDATHEIVVGFDLQVEFLITEIEFSYLMTQGPCLGVALPIPGQRRACVGASGASFDVVAVIRVRIFIRPFVCNGSPKRGPVCT